MRRALPALAAACLPLLAACSLIGGGDDGPFPTISPRPGMTGTSWSNFAFGAPSEWTEDHSDSTTYWSDASGETVMSGTPTGLAGCVTPGGPDGLGKPGTYHKGTRQTVTAVRHFHVPGAGGALRYTLTGGEHGHEVALQVWTRDCHDEMVLDIYATGDADRIADTIIAKDG